MPIKQRGNVDIKKDLKAITTAIEQNAEGIRLVTFNTVKGGLVRRIFNEGIATDGTPIGHYAESTKKLRALAGRQTAKVDLELTGTERRAVVVGTSDNRSVIGILGQPEPKVEAVKGRLKITGTSGFATDANAISQEKHFNKEIFAPSKEETDRGEKTLVKEIHRVVKKALL